MKRQQKLSVLCNICLNNSYFFFNRILILGLILVSTLSFAQTRDKLSASFLYLIEHPIKKGAKISPQPELYKIDAVKGLNPKTGEYEDGYICIIYTKFPEVLKESGIVVQSIYPTFITAWVTLEQIPIIADLKGVTFIDAPQISIPNNDISVASSGASLLHAGKVNNTVYKGDGVIVAIIDTGIDWDHPDFRTVDDQSKSRILRIWDQTLTPILGEVSPLGFNYGVEYTQTQINNEIDGTPADFVREKDIHGHGTHVAGTAAGNGSALTTFKYTGLAPNADIVVVKGGDGTFKSTNIINALSYLQNLATTLGKPIVVNMSLGGQYTAHDGTDAEEIAVDAFTNSAAGRIVVIAAGNDNGSAIHKQNSLVSGGNATVSIVVPIASASTSTSVFQYTLFANDSSEINATLTAPDGTNVSVNSGSSDGYPILGGLATVYFSNIIDPDSGDRMINAYVVRANTTTNVTGTWVLMLTNTTSNTLTLDGWLNYKGSNFANTKITSGDNNYLVESPGCATYAITVGAYMAKLDWQSSSGAFNSYGPPSQQDNISTFSSIGPRRDNVRKPDITANGQGVISCLSSDSVLLNTNSNMVVNGLYRTNQGTSMATPEVTGCVALLLQINKTSTFSQIKTALTAAATKDVFTTSSDNNIWGSGKIDVFKAASSQLYCNSLDRVTYSYDAAYTRTNNTQKNVGDFKTTTRFTPAISGRLGGVYFKAGSTVTLTSFTIEVRTNNGGIPGILLNSLNIDTESISKGSWNYYDLSSLNIEVASGTDYFIVLVPGASSTFYLGQDPATVGRSFYYDGAAWVATTDLRIRSVVYTSGKPSITLSSLAGTNIQTGCTSNAITAITYSTTGATGANFSGLPAGVTGIWTSNLVTISGVPSASGNFNYTITLTGGCGTVSETGSITVLPSTENTTTISTCDNYTWNGQTYTESGLYTGTTTNCITDKLDLTINSNTIKTEPISATICKSIGGTASFTVVTSAATATYQWYSQAATATTWTALTNTANYSGATTSTLNITKTTTTLPATGTKYKLVVTNSCGIVTSAIVTITDFTVFSKVAAISAKSSTNAALSPVSTICQGNSLNLTLAAGSIGNIQWQSSTDGISFDNIGLSIDQMALSASNLAIPFTTEALTQDTWFRIVASNGVCNSVNGVALKITVSSPANPGMISGGDVTVCKPLAIGLDSNGNALTTDITNSITLTLSDYTLGATILWQKSTNYVSSTNATPVWASAGSTTNTLTASALTVNTWYRAQVTNGACKDFTVPVKITVSPSAIAGVITSVASVCTGGTIAFTSAAIVGDAIQWEYTTDAPLSATNTTAQTWSVIAGANELIYTKIDVSNTPGTKFYIRAKITSGACTSAYSAVKTIIVNPLSVGGTATGGGTICFGSNGALKVAGYTGAIQWESSADGINYDNVSKGLATIGTNYVSGSITGTAATYLVTAITADTYFRAKITSGACSVTYSNVVKYTVGTAAVSGTITAAITTVCSGTGTTLTLANAIGAIKWWKSTNWTAATPNWTAVTTSTSGTLATGNLTVATAYKTDVTIGSCSTSTSNLVAVLLYNAPLAKTVTANVTSPSGTTSALAICTSVAKTLNIGTGSNGAIQWQTSTTSTTLGFTDIPNATVTSYMITNPALGVNYFRAKFTNSCGVSLYGTAFTVYYKDCSLVKVAETKVVTKVAFEVLAYPNPTSNNFNLAISTSSSENVEVRVFDEIGRLINKMEVSPTEVSGLQIGDNYPAGVYNVVVTQGTELKTLRVIKK